MRYFKTVFVAALAASAAGVGAQQPKPVAKPVEPSATVTLTVRGAEAERFLTVNAVSADVRGLLKDMATKADVVLYLSPSVSGVFTGTLDSMAAEKAIATVATTTGLKFVRITLPKDTPTMTADAAGKVFEALTVLPAAAQASDGSAGKSVLVSNSPAVAASDAKVVYYVQGKQSPDQERAGQEQRAALRGAKSATSSTNAIAGAIAAFNKMPVQDRLNAMRDMQRQMMQSMTPQDMQQLRQQQHDQRGRRFQRTN